MKRRWRGVINERSCRAAYRKSHCGAACAIYAASCTATEIPFAEYGIAKPQAQAVLGVEDKGIVEFRLVFAKA